MLELVLPVSFFKTCECCRKEWQTRDKFLADKDIVIVGYQANFVALRKGLFLFNHSCHSTLSVEVHVFADLYDGPIFADRLTGTDACAGYCLHRNALQSCPKQCECAYVREILQHLTTPSD